MKQRQKLKSNTKYQTRPLTRDSNQRWLVPRYSPVPDCNEKVEADCQKADIAVCRRDDWTGGPDATHEPDSDRDRR